MQEEKNNQSHGEYIAYLCDRAEKITQAVYRVSDLLSEKEPLKWEAREKALTIFTSLISLRHKDELEIISHLVKLENLIDELMPLLSLMGSRFSISSTNFEILRNEYSAVKNMILEEKKRELFLDIPPESLKLPDFNGQTNGQESIGQVVGQIIGQDNNGQIKSAISFSKKSKFKPSIENRQKRILDIVKEKERATIGELAVMFSECGEKTIQRDLSELVEKGMLRKEGDKRWRTYIFDRIN